MELIENYITSEQAKFIYETIMKMQADKDWRSLKKNHSALSFAPIGYTYGRVEHPAKAKPLWIERLCHKVGKDLGLPFGNFNQCLINIYADGVGIGEHKDDEDIYQSEDGHTAIVCISLGVTKRPHLINGKEIDVPSLSLYQIDTDTLHNAAPAKGTRISLTFRHIPNI